MFALWNLLGKSPFAPLQAHMEKVHQAIHLVPELFKTLDVADRERHEQIVEQIAALEHEADLIKDHLRSHLPKGLFLPIAQSHLLEILTIQDSLADKAEDIAVLTTFKTLSFWPGFLEPFNAFLIKNIDAFDEAYAVTKELHELLESSFGGIEAEKVQKMVRSVAFKEHEADLIQRKVLKELFNSEEKISYASFELWRKILEAISSIANLSENLGGRIRMTLELED